MNSGCSDSIPWATWVSPAAAIASCHQMSRESFQATSWPVRRTTSTFCTDVSAWSSAASTAGLRALGAPRR